MEDLVLMAVPCDLAASFPLLEQHGWLFHQLSDKKIYISPDVQSILAALETVKKSAAS